MKKTLIVVIMLFAAFAANAVELLPSINATAQQRAQVYLAICYLTGYSEVVNGVETRDPAQWTNTAAIAAHDRAWYLAQAKEVVKNAYMLQNPPPVPTPIPIE